jgi:hypothetical protein
MFNEGDDEAYRQQALDKSLMKIGAASTNAEGDRRRRRMTGRSRSGW